MRKLITLILLLTLFFSAVSTSAHGGEEGTVEDVFYKAPKLNSSIAIDGDESDWEDVPAMEIELYSWIGVEVEEEFVIDFKVAYDSESIYYLVEIADHYAFNATNSALTPALGIATSINASTAAHMGAPSATELGTSTGAVDIMHWDIQTEPGVVVGGNSTSGQGEGNLDDEYATVPSNRYADNVENSYTGTYIHSNATQGAEGHYTFEIKRDLTTDDPNDVQFVEGQQYEFNIAYWTPEQSEDGWSPTGHFTYGARIFIGLGVVPTEPVTETNGLPFATPLMIMLALISVPLIRRRLR